MDNIVLLMSGGIDSLIAWYYLDKPRAIYIPLCTPYSNKEQAALVKLKSMCDGLADKLTITQDINIGQFQYGEKAFIRHRNLILAAIASNYGDNIVIAGTEDDCVEDKSEIAFNKMTECLRAISPPGDLPSVTSPFWHMSKSDIIYWAMNNVHNSENIMRASVSCYDSKVNQCGLCPSCLRKAVAFTVNGLKIDFFENDVRTSPLISQYKQSLSSTRYTARRVADMKIAFTEWGAM